MFTDSQITAAKAILLIEEFLQPKCQECGVGIDRPNCANDMGGYCRKDETHEAEAYYETIRAIEVHAGLDKIWSWRFNVPLSKVYSFTKNEILLLRGLAETGPYVTSTYDNRYTRLSSRGAVDCSAMSKWTYKINKKGDQLLADLEMVK